MFKFSFLFVASIIAATSIAYAQQYSIVIKGGHVIDAKNNIDGVMDVAVQDGKIAKVDKNIDTSGALQIVDAKGMYVTPVSLIFTVMFSLVLSRIIT